MLGSRGSSTRRAWASSNPARRSIALPTLPQVNVEDAVVEPMSKGTFNMDYVMEVATEERALYCQASSKGDLDKWVKALRKASRKHGAGGVTDMDAEEAKFDSLPSVVAVVGTLESGSELKVFAKPPDLSSLHISWFRCNTNEVSESNLAEVVPPERFIGGANLQTYVLKPEDVGHFIGCAVRDKPGSRNKSVRVAVSRKTVKALDITTVSCRIALRTHAHNKYCDRKEKVRCGRCATPLSIASVRNVCAPPPSCRCDRCARPSGSTGKPRSWTCCCAGPRT